MAFRAQRTVSALDGRVGWTVVDDDYEEQPEVRAYLRWLRFGTDAAEGTARQYACRLALFFSWLDSTGRDWKTLGLDEFASFMLWLQRSPSRRPRRPSGAEVVHLRPGKPTRSDRTVNYVMTVVREFYRFQVLHGIVDPAMAERLGGPRPQPFLPRTLLPEGASPSRVDTRTLRKKTPTTAPPVVSEAQAQAVADACARERDRFLVLVCWRCGLRISEAVGLHREDLHFLPSSVHLGCTISGSHLHVRRREANENGAMAKSRRPRAVPADRDVVAAHRAYGAERDQVPEAAGSDFVFVNLFAAPLGRAMTPDGAEELFERLSARVGFRVRPHMLRHCFGTSLAAAGVAPDVIAELMGHASIVSTEIYLHPDWDRLVAAVLAVGSADSQSARTGR